MDKQKLTLEAQAAVRQYMVRLVTLPGVAITIVAFLPGFFVKEVAKQGAYNDAYKVAQASISDLLGEAQKSAINAERMKEVIEQKSQEIKKIHEEANDIRAKLKTAEKFQNSENLVAIIADNLSNRIDFQRSVTGNFGNRLSQVESKTGNFRLDFKTWKQGQRPKRLIKKMRVSAS